MDQYSQFHLEEGWGNEEKNREKWPVSPQQLSLSQCNIPLSLQHPARKFCQWKHVDFALFVKIKPWGSCTKRSGFACTASFSWELKHFTLPKDIYCQKLRFHCLGTKTSVTQIKQIIRPRVSHWSQRNEVRIWFKGGMTHEKTLHGDGNLITAKRSCYHHASQG